MYCMATSGMALAVLSEQMLLKYICRNSCEVFREIHVFDYRVPREIDVSELGQSVHTPFCKIYMAKTCVSFVLL